ncbi:RMD1 family protein [Paracrocinitomix mangrovi]|uniref:RMD1 family protein n=1 Tax=Paracrocinitomix mangrovi TaxID=2862509 RepID=UPI001C8E8BA2|nr:RMD1 family protein [Paracrocinitomix mangrovi]UKN01401.1 RMD1 family protein [Paracrocinitomix mangrovi]
MLELKSTAYHLGEHISIVSAIKELDYTVSKTENEFALFEVSESSWIYLKNYGSIVFINVDDAVRKKTMKLFLDNVNEMEGLPSDDFVVIVTPEVLPRADFGKIYVPNISIDVAHVIALNMAQTVALDDFQYAIESLLEQTRDFSIKLKKEGKINLSRREVRQMIGQTLVLKNRIAENLYIFDSPDVIWDDKMLTELDSQMHADLEFVRRHEGLQLNLTTIKENLDAFQSILQHKHSSLLEWIIIILILAEVLQIILEKL